MKSSSITGLAYAFVPVDSFTQDTQTAVQALAKDFVVSSNNFYLFEGEMPASNILQVYNDSAKLLTDFGAKLITKITNFDIKYTYDHTTRTRKLQKFPINAVTLTSAKTGTAGWACLELKSKNTAESLKCFLFTDAVGGWDDPSQSVLLSKTAVVSGETLTVKDINITLRDALLVDL